MNLLGAQAAASFGAEPAIKAWADGVAINPARITPDHSGSAVLDGVLGRLQTHTSRGLAKLGELCGEAPV
jgi:hypothetical protein